MFSIVLFLIIYNYIQTFLWISELEAAKSMFSVFSDLFLHGSNL